MAFTVPGSPAAVCEQDQSGLRHRGIEKVPMRFSVTAVQNKSLGGPVDFAVKCVGVLPGPFRKEVLRA